MRGSLIGAHVLYDKTVKREDEPCGLCLRPEIICKVYLKKGKGSKGGQKIDKDRSNCPLKLLRFNFAVAAVSTASSPCSNVPVLCPLCPKTAPAVFKYNWRAHFTNIHPHASYENYASIGNLTKFEKKEMTGIWKDRHRIPAKRIAKGKDLNLEVSIAHSSNGALGTTSIATESLDDLNGISNGNMEAYETETEPISDDNLDNASETDYYEPSTPMTCDDLDESFEGDGDVETVTEEDEENQNSGVIGEIDSGSEEEGVNPGENIDFLNLDN
ncbi:hypothetical protein H0H92_006478, partial [Tricholoma furcatifolium]